jgi:hypothetical protein
LPAGVGGTTGRGTSVDLIGGNGSRLFDCGDEKAGWLTVKPPSVNIVTSIVMLVFIFLIAQALEKILCRRGDRTFVAGTVGA